MDEPEQLSLEQIVTMKNAPSIDIPESKIEPQHYRNPNSKYKDLYEKWSYEYGVSEYRAIMKSIAERYISRYERKNGIEDLEKGIYTLERLRDYEREKRS